METLLASRFSGSNLASETTRLSTLCDVTLMNPSVVGQLSCVINVVSFVDMHRKVKRLWKFLTQIFEVLSYGNLRSVFLGFPENKN